MTLFQAVQDDDQRIIGVISGETQEEIEIKLRAHKLKKYGFIFTSHDLKKPSKTTRKRLYGA